MIKKILLVPVFLFLMVMIGCSTSNQSMVLSNSPNLNSFEISALQYNEKYLQSKSDEDFINLCDKLTVLPWKEKQLRELVLEYYPTLFEKFDEDQVGEISQYGFDPFYAEYVYAYKAEEIGGLIPVYSEYKKKANNIYMYAKTVYGFVLQLDNISAEEYDFLYKEAYNLYSTSRDAVRVYTTADENREAFLEVLNAFGCINDICEALEKEVDPTVERDLEDYSAEYKKIMDNYK